MKRSCEQLFQEPLKVPCFEVKNRVQPDFVEEKMQTSSASASVSYSDSEPDYFKAINTALEMFFDEIQKEERLLLEASHPLSMSLQCSTGLSLARDILPVIKVSSVNAFSENYGQVVSFTEYEWNKFFYHLSGSVKKYFESDEQQQESPLRIVFDDYVITSSKFLHEKVVKIQWNGKANVYMNRGVFFKLLDLVPLIEKRLKMLEKMELSNGYYNILRVVNDVLDPCEEMCVKEPPVELIRKFSNCVEDSLSLLFDEVILYNPDRIVRDLQKLRCIYYLNDCK